MNKSEIENLWKFLKSEDLALAQMGLAMAKGIRDEKPKTELEKIIKDQEYHNFTMKIYNKSNSVMASSKNFECEVSYNRYQVRVWYWFSVIDMMNDDEIEYNYSLDHYNKYKKELAELNNECSIGPNVVCKCSIDFHGNMCMCVDCLGGGFHD